MSFALAQYQNARVETASPVQLVVDLYRGAIRFIRQAQAFHDAKDYAARGKALSRSHAIISELLATLDHNQAPELCAQLESLYHFVLQRISEANTNADYAKLDAAVDVLNTLEGAWSELAGRV